MNSFTKTGYVLLAVVLRATFGAEHPALSVSTDFTGGSAEVMALDRETGVIHIRPALQEARGWPCWWYVRVDGATAGKHVTLRVSGNPGIFRPKGKPLAADWAQPLRAVISTDDRNWTQTDNVVMEASTKTAAYRVVAPDTRFWLAWGPPFLPSHATTVLKEMAAADPNARLFNLATSRGGRPVVGIRIGSSDAPAAVWVQARQHAWECGSSWVSLGFLKWVNGDDPLARTLRESAELFIVPVMDVDNVALGAGGKGALPHDHNRDWSDHPLYPEVAAAQRYLRDLDQAERLRLFVDLHNPSPSDQRSFFYGPRDDEAMPRPVKANYSRWLAVAALEITDPLPIQLSYRFPTYAGTEKERSRMSAAWVRNNTTAERVTSVTLESSWNTTASTQEGYLTMGEQLGRTVAYFLAPESP